METITLDVEEGIATLTLNRPDVLNALNRKMLEELWSTSSRLGEGDVRVVVIRGAGRAFSAGADIKEFGRWAGKPTSVFRQEVRGFHDFYDFLERLEKPVVAAINGVCVGGGLEIALSCDFRLAREGTRLGFPEYKLGLIPNSGGCSRTMRLIGPGHTKELVMLGELINAEYAQSIGLVEHVYAADEFDDKVSDFVSKLAARPPQALAMAKYAIDNAMETDRGTGRYIERLAQSVLLRTDDHEEGVAAFLEKRDPAFTGD
jgi:enoyl-CoA hydratase/carnithine racemase